MKMSYLHANDTRKKRFLKPATFLFLAVVLALIFLSPARSFLSNSLGALGHPLWLAQASLSDKFLLGAFIKSRIFLVSENQALKEDLLKANLQAKEIEILREELRILRPVFLGATSSQFPSLVLRRPPQTPYDTLIIDVGQADLKGGEKVFFESVLLGEVIEILGRTAKVRLYSSGGVETTAFVGVTGVSIVAEGKGGGNFEARVQGEAQIEKGDFIIAADTTGKFLGQVEEIEENPTSSFKRILFRYPLNISGLRWVTVDRLINE